MIVSSATICFFFSSSIPFVAALQPLRPSSTPPLYRCRLNRRHLNRRLQGSAMGTDSGSGYSKVISHGSPQTSTMKSKKKRNRENEHSGGGRVLVQENDQPPVSEEYTRQKTMDVKIELIYEQIDKTPPIVGYFPSGYNPHKKVDQEVNPLSASAPPSVSFYRKAQRIKTDKSPNEKNEKGKSSERLELVVRPNGSKIDFVGKSYKGEAMAAQLCTYALGVLDKETQTLKVMPIAANKIFRLEPKVRGLDTADKEPLVLENVELSGEQRAKKIMELDLRYGTKKSVARGKKMQALNQVDNASSQEDLGKIIENAQVDKDTSKSTTAHVPRNIPPHNSSAETPQEAYPLDRIIFTGEWDSLDDIYNILQVQAEVSTDDYPTFVCNRIHKLREIQDEVEKKTRSRILSYITHLIKFKYRHSRDDAPSAKNHRFPNILYQKFLGLFNPERNRLSDEKNDLLVSYVLVLTLYADDFQTTPDDIAKDLRMRPIPLRPHFENLGCKISPHNRSMLATLPVPLKFPTVKQKRRGRG